ncbi:hypothetical protein [Glaciimonas immobilis]|uniref:Uncharacterized protein n=1 Tax=Glaciimonas immobilis TaxID=728004 RepID=A0A840RZX7_9BURK|nr:hypothetical protein [Glaciimonas immobilis]KAF3998460.1 hypothetical protein HAV38_08430 [Glaciimonas immobilis]MBB5202041.1 hypothetical protein [Glaciimonas immobilis]
MITKKILLGLGSGLLLSLLLGGCGGGGGDFHAPVDLTGANNGAEPVAAQDAFIDSVNGIVATTSDVSEPTSIDSLMATTPDNTAPLSFT